MKKNFCVLLALLLMPLANALAQAAAPVEVTAEVMAEGVTFTLTLQDHSAARSLLAQLPLTLSFEDYNQTEKIAYPPETLDLSDAPGSCDPQVGTLAYYAPWGNLCIFYRDFPHSEGLVPLGQLEGDLQLLAGMEDGFEMTLQAVSPSNAPAVYMTTEIAPQERYEAMGHETEG